MSLKISSLTEPFQPSVVLAVFYMTLACYAFISADAETTVLLSSRYSLYIPLNSLIFLFGGTFIVLFNLNDILKSKISTTLLISGPIFAVYVLAVIVVKMFLGRPYSHSDMFYTCIELYFIVLAIFMAYSYLAAQDKKGIKTLQVLSLAILGILICYYLVLALSSSLLPRIQSLSGMNFSVEALNKSIDPSIGYRRLSGPLGHSTGLGILLIPISGYFLYLTTLKTRKYYWAIIIISQILILLTGSRIAIYGGFLLLAFFFFKYRTFLILLCIPLLIFFFYLMGFNLLAFIPQKLSPFQSLVFSDHFRILALKTCANAWLSSTSAFLFGAGYNEIFLLTKKWFLSSAGLMAHEHIITKYGFLPGGPHSLFNWAIAATGIIGLLLRGAFIFEYSARLVNKILHLFPKKYLIFPVSIFISFFNFFTDDSQINYPMLTACWLVFFIFSLKMLYQESSQVGNEPT